MTEQAKANSLAVVDEASCRADFEAYERGRWDTSDFSRWVAGAYVGEYKSRLLQEAWEYWRDSRVALQSCNVPEPRMPGLPEDGQLETIALTGGFVDCLRDLPDDPEDALREAQRVLARYYRTVHRRFARANDTAKG